MQHFYYDGREHKRREAWRRAGLCFVFLWFLLGGVAHFAFTDAMAGIVPRLVPWPHEAVLLSGMFELAGAAGLLLRRSRRAAGLGLALLTLVVTPANVVMLENAQAYDVPHWLLVARLPFQAVLLGLILWSTAHSVSRRH